MPKISVKTSFGHQSIVASPNASKNDPTKPSVIAKTPIISWHSVETILVCPNPIIQLDIE